LTTTQATVLAEITDMIRLILDEYGLEETEITMDTKFHEDLDMESIDLVTLGGQLADRYGDRVNFAEFIANLDLDEIISLEIGRLVNYVVGCLCTVETR
jgi:acyl carrier protein